MLQAEALKKIYRKGSNEVHSLRGVDLKVEQGELIFLVGPSGSGKSTLLQILGALDRPTSGRVLLDGEDIFSRTDRELALMRRNRFGFVFQSFNLVSTLTAMDNVLCPLIPEGITQAKRDDATKLLSDLGLAERTHHKPYELSGGEQQRVALARALVGNPDIIFADEPTGELDSKKGREIIDMIRRMNVEKNVTVLIVTHATQHIKPDDKVLHLLDGEIAPGE